MIDLISGQRALIRLIACTLPGGYAKTCQMASWDSRILTMTVRDRPGMRSSSIDLFCSVYLRGLVSDGSDTEGFNEYLPANGHTGVAIWGTSISPLRLQ